MVEYDRARTVAVVEYKHERAAPQAFDHPSYRAIKSLADQARVGFFVARYSIDHSGAFTSFAVRALNDFAEDALGISERGMSEAEYVELLYGLRGRTVPPEVAQRLGNPPDAWSAPKELWEPHPLEALTWHLAGRLGVSLREAVALARDYAGLEPRSGNRTVEELRRLEAATVELLSIRVTLPPGVHHG